MSSDLKHNPDDLSLGTLAHQKKMAPERTCVACRNVFAQEWLLRLVLAPGGSTPLIDYLGKLPGRGVYVCPTFECLKKAVERGGLRRGFQQTISTTTDSLIEEAVNASSRQLSSLVGLASRAGKTSCGHSQVEQMLRKQEVHLLLMAKDASEGVQRKFRQWAERMNLPVFSVLSKEELGAITRGYDISLIVVTDSGFTKKIVREVERAVQLNAVVNKID